MSHLALTSVIVGIVIIASRAPLAFAPAASTSAIRWLSDSNARIRFSGVIFGGVGLAMILSARASDDGAAWIILIGGWAWMAAALMLWTLPSFYRRIALLVADTLKDSMWPRGLGVIGTLFGVFLVYVGIAVY